MDAWIDCMTNIDDGMTHFTVAPGELLHFGGCRHRGFRKETPRDLSGFDRGFGVCKLAARRGWRAADFGIGSVMNHPSPNKSVETNRRSPSPLDARRQFESVSCARPFLSAAVAHVYR